MVVKKDYIVGTIFILAGIILGFIIGCLITWFPIRILFCIWYNAPDCEEIVLISFPFYCIIAPLCGGIVAYLLYRKKRKQARYL